MKLIKSIPSIILAAYSIVLLSACDGDNGPTAKETQLNKLAAKTWNIQSVKVDGVDYTTQFTGMTLSITKNSFSTTSGGLVWPTTATWEFGDDQATTIIRGDGISVTIEAISDSQLRLSLLWNETTFGPGRKESISGTHVFSFN